MFVQMCEKHYQKVKNCVPNKHALQALPGDSWSGDIGELDVDVQSLRIPSLTPFVQGMETNTHTTTMEHRQVFAWIFHPQIKM